MMFKKMLANLESRAHSSSTISRDEIAEMLKINPSLLEKFETAYKNTTPEDDDNFFNKNSKQAANERKANKIDLNIDVDNIVEAITEELLIDAGLLDKNVNFLTAGELNLLPAEVRPQLAGNLVQRDVHQPAYLLAMDYYKRWKKTGDIGSYHRFRQGLDILDLDPILYELIGTNKNSMGYWIKDVEQAADKGGFFKYPKTKVVKIPLPLLQLTRLPYEEHTPTTIRILNEFCMRAFELDVNKKYFIKTGTYSSKFDFRNALVEGEKEVQEIGEYLLYIHYQALQMASPLSSPTIYGVSTTNEWVVREFIDDVEDNPTIYKGMPLHTEYRFFVDLDTKEIIGVSPYWREDVMKKSFTQGEQNNHKRHDYVIYKMHEEKLYERYNKNIAKLTEEIQKVVNNMNLSGQWSLDIMQNGDDFYVIDMASAAESALSDVVDQSKLEKTEEDWIPKLENKQGE